MVEELSLHEEIDALEELRHLWMIDHRHIQQSVVWNGIRGLTIACGISYAHGHHLALDDIRINLDVHAIIEALEYHQHK